MTGFAYSCSQCGKKGARRVHLNRPRICRSCELEMTRPKADQKLLRKLFPPARWTHHENGAITVGRILDAPVLLKFLDHEKPCSRCRTPATTGTPRGRAVHPGCDGTLDRLSESAFHALVWDLPDDWIIEDAQP